MNDRLDILSSQEGRTSIGTEEILMLVLHKNTTNNKMIG